jgi:hypothetical protein
MGYQKKNYQIPHFVEPKPGIMEQLSAWAGSTETSETLEQRAERLRSQASQATEKPKPRKNKDYTIAQLPLESSETSETLEQRSDRLRSQASQAPPEPERPPRIVRADDEVQPGKMTLREYGNAAVKLACMDHEEANAHSKWEMDAFFFFMRRMKSHPKLMNTDALAASGVMQRLAEQEPAINQFVDDCGMSFDDVVAFVIQRWTSCRTFAGLSPLEAALDLAYRRTVIEIPSEVVYWSKDDPKRRRPAPTKEQWLSAPMSVQIEPATITPPTYGIFCLMVFHAWKLLSIDHPCPDKLEIILGTDSISELFKKRGVKISGKTIWDYRVRMEKACALVKLPKAGIADRFWFDLQLFQVMILTVTAQAEAARKRAGIIDLD